MRPLPTAQVAAEPAVLPVLTQQAHAMYDAGHLSHEELDEVLFECAIQAGSDVVQAKQELDEQVQAGSKLQSLWRRHVQKKARNKMFAAARAVTDSLTRFSKVLVCGFEVRKHPNKKSFASPAIRVLFMMPSGHLCMNKTKSTEGARKIALWKIDKITDGASRDLFNSSAAAMVRARERES